MRKIKFILLSIILIFFIINIDIVIDSTKEASILFFNHVFIVTAPFIILSDILIYYDYHIFLKNTIGSYFSKIFKIDSNTCIVFILSILTSMPTNSIIVKDLLDKKIIDENTANKIMCFTYFPSIPFVIGTIGISMYKSFKIGLILYLICLINNILIGLYLRKDKTSIESSNYNINNIKEDLFTALNNSIIKCINTSMMILGNLIVFTIIINLSNKYLDNTLIITSLLEITNAVVKVSNLNIDFIYKMIITIFILDFGSLSILFQSFSILSKHNINKKRILLIKLVFSFLTFIILNIIYFIIR